MAMAMARRASFAHQRFRAYLRTSAKAEASAEIPSSLPSPPPHVQPRPSTLSRELPPSLASPSPLESSASPPESSSSSLPSSSSSFLHPTTPKVWSIRSHASQISTSSSASSSEGSSIAPFFDAISLVRKLESQGFDAKQAEAITSAMTDVLNDCLQNVSDSFVSKSELQQFNMMQEGAYEKLQTDVQSSQEKKISSIHRDTEKLRSDIEKLQTEIRYEMDKVTAGQRLDLNLERGRIKEELANRNAETSNLTNRLDKDINILKSQLEASKYEVIKYCIGTIVSVYALGLALLRIFK